MTEPQKSAFVGALVEALDRLPANTEAARVTAQIWPHLHDAVTVRVKATVQGHTPSNQHVYTEGVRLVRIR